MKGVTKVGKYWRATLGIDGKNLYLGQSCTQEEAIYRRVKAEKKYFGKEPERFGYKAKKGELITQKRLKLLFTYDSITGLLTRNINRGFKVKRGQIITHKNKDGYPSVRIDGRQYRVHRLAFLYMKGYFPKYVDHKDTVRDNNKWSNLRDATSQINNQNRTSNNSPLGIKGIRWDTRDKKYTVRLCINYKTKNLYRGYDFFEACCSRKSAENKHFNKE